MINNQHQKGLQILDNSEINAITGGGTAEWAVSVGAATAFLGMALAVSNPVGIGVLAAASIASSTLAMLHKRN
ncbi:hypothetical protein [Aliiglaciecola litoralis]|uniref:Class IIb bacteriocin, lactobin A/cerein 7B family n=1 Tax=Aliiglaciecola litoralis TaxID=582857 RepID=A0ABP3WT27_9ALTE